MTGARFIRSAAKAIFDIGFTQKGICTRFITVLVAVVAWFLPASADGERVKAFAGEAAAHIKPEREVSIFVSGGQLVEMKSPGATMFVADPSIADIQVPNPLRIFIFGKKPGRTTFFALNAEGEPVDSFTIVVSYSDEDLRRLLRAELGDIPIEVTNTPRGMVLSGIVPNAEMAEKIRTAAIRLAGEGNTLVNNLQISGSVQVSLRVRVAEVSRSVIKELGVNWEAIGSMGAFTFGLVTGRDFVNGSIIERAFNGAGFAFAGASTRRANVTALVDALAQEGLISILAEPNLTAVSGQKASFLAGGEFPVPVTQSENRTAIDFRRFGVSLDFTPVVLSDRLISINVRPEVSELSEEGSVVLNNFRVPSLRTRRAETTVELGSGESLVIGGLIQNTFSTDIEKFPGLGDVPVLGALFRSSRFRKNQSELIIIVTPYIVRPNQNPNEILVPTDLVTPPADLERIIEGRLGRDPNASNEPAPPVRLRGEAGFIFK